ncbi:MAG: WYL domain-containing protein [Oscillospiraceae bacterium]|nr:WYL domain-containing protein [Oscillospiraceae bacterium]
MNLCATYQLLRLLQEETDEGHTMSQKRIIERMQERFDIKLNRRQLRSYLSAMEQAGFPLCYRKTVRQLANGTEEELLTDFFIEPYFEPSELRIIFDLLYAMPAIPEYQRESLLKKLKNSSSPTFRERIPCNQVNYLNAPCSKQIMYFVEIICEAISANCMLQFQYGSYKLDRTAKPVLKPRCKPEGEAREYLVSPYDIIVSHGRYYLVCCNAAKQTLSTYRIDRIMNIQMKSDFKRTPIDEVDASILASNNNVAEKLYMYYGDSITVKFKADNKVLGDVLDWFGAEIDFSSADEEGKFIATVQTHPIAMRHWALQYAEYVQILEPPSLIDDICKIAKKVLKE